MSRPQSFIRGSLGIAAGMAIMLTVTAPAVAKHRRSHHHPAAAPKVQAAPAEAPDDGTCAEALKKGLAQETAGQLQAATEVLRSCARPTCPAFVREQCGTHLRTLENDTPTVVLMVSDASGGSHTDVQVRVDGTPFAPQLDGSPLAIDPGMHDFSFSSGGHVFATEKVLILQGQRNRFITAIIDATGSGHIANEREQTAVELRELPRLKSPRPAATAKTAAVAAAAPAAPAEVAAATNDGDSSEGTGSDAAEGVAPKKHTLLPVLIGGVGVASLGAAALLTYWGRKDNDSLAQCSPGCDPSGPRHIRRLYYGADAAIGVGIAALTAAYLVYAINHHPSGEAAGGETALRFGLEPTRTGGGVASVFGSF